MTTHMISMFETDGAEEVDNVTGVRRPVAGRCDAAVERPAGRPVTRPTGHPAPRRLRHALVRLEAGEDLAELAREFDLPPSELRLWQERLAGGGCSRVDRVLELERENERLRKLVQELRLDKYMLEQLLKSRG